MNGGAIGYCPHCGRAFKKGDRFATAAMQLDIQGEDMFLILLVHEECASEMMAEFKEQQIYDGS